VILSFSHPVSFLRRRTHCTFLGGGWSDPMSFFPEIVAKDVDVGPRRLSNCSSFAFSLHLSVSKSPMSLPFLRGCRPLLRLIFDTAQPRLRPPSIGTLDGAPEEVLSRAASCGIAAGSERAPSRSLHSRLASERPLPAPFFLDFTRAKSVRLALLILSPCVLGFPSP